MHFYVNIITVVMKKTCKKGFGEGGEACEGVCAGLWRRGREVFVVGEDRESPLEGCCYLVTPGRERRERKGGWAGRNIPQLGGQEWCACSVTTLQRQ